MAGITSVTFTYPLDIVRTRLSVQSASFKELGRKTGEKLPGMWQLMVIMYKTEGGFPALYRGILPTVAGVAPYVRIENTCLLIDADRIRLVSTSWCMRPCAASSPLQAKEIRVHLGNLLLEQYQVQ
jgi:hypothetical protein